MKHVKTWGKWLLAYCLEYAYARMWKEWSNDGLQDAKNASSASCCAPRDAHCGKRSKQEVSRSSCVQCQSLPSLPQTLPKHSPASCYLWMHRRSSKWELETMSFVQQQWNLHGIKVLGTTISICQLSIRKWQCTARPVGAGRSGRGSCGRWCKAHARAGPRAKQLRRLHALQLPWQPVSKRQLSEAPTLQWFQRPEGWTEHRGSGTSQQSASAPFLFLRMQRRQPKPVAPPHRESPAAKGPWRPSQTQ